MTTIIHSPTVIRFIKPDGTECHQAPVYSSEPAMRIQLELSLKLGYPVSLLIDKEAIKSWQDCSNIVRRRSIEIKKIPEEHNIWNKIMSFASDTSPLMECESFFAILSNPHHMTETKINMLTFDDPDGIQVEVHKMDEHENHGVVSRITQSYVKLLTAISGSLYQVPNYTITLEIMDSDTKLQKYIKFIQSVSKKMQFNNRLWLLMKDTDGHVTYYSNKFENT